MVKTLDWYSEGKRIETGLREGKKSVLECVNFNCTNVQQYNVYFRQNILHLKCNTYTFCLNFT